MPQQQHQQQHRLQEVTAAAASRNLQGTTCTPLGATNPDDNAAAPFTAAQQWQ
jgi:hypothetical protein